MRIVTRWCALLVSTICAAVSVLAVTMTAAHATDYAVGGGPTVKLVGTGISFKVMPSAITTSCASHAINGTVVNPGVSRVWGSPAATLTSSTASSCVTNPGSLPTTVTHLGTWNLAFTGASNPAGTVWPAQLGNVRFSVAFAGCTYVLQGVIRGSFDETTQRFTPTTGSSGLTVATSPPPSGALCTTLDVLPGDDAEVAGYWTNTPPAGSTPLVGWSGYAVTGAGVTFIGTGVGFTDIPAAQPVTSCTPFDMSGSVVSSGAYRAFGSPAVSLPTRTISGCTGPATLTPSGTWNLTVTGDPNPARTVWPVRLTGVTLAFARASCSFSMSGSIQGTFNEANQRFTPSAGASGLTISTNPVGSLCVTFDFQQDDEIEVGGYWTNTATALDFS